MSSKVTLWTPPLISDPIVGPAPAAISQLRTMTSCVGRPYFFEPVNPRLHADCIIGDGEVRVFKNNALACVYVCHLHLAHLHLDAGQSKPRVSRESSDVHITAVTEMNIPVGRIPRGEVQMRTFDTLEKNRFCGRL